MRSPSFMGWRRAAYAIGALGLALACGKTMSGPSVGSCAITSGPAVASATKPYVYATVVRDADSRMIRYAP